MEAATRRDRAWRITLADGQAPEVSGVKVVVTDVGALMVLDDVRAASPTHIFAPGNWLDCTQITPRTGSDR